MEFLEENQIEQWCADRHVPFPLPSSGVLRESTRFFGGAVSPRGQEAAVAAAVLDDLGPWDECLLWIREWSVWPSSENWPAYYAERARHGEQRSLEVAPGHLALPADRDGLGQFLRITLENAWDAVVIPVVAGRGAGRWARVSHDEYVDIFIAPRTPP